MVDLSKVSKAVQTFVADVAKTEGKKKEIDTKAEYNKLSEHLAGNNDLNVHEKEFIQGFMIEYENKQKAAEQKEFEDSVTKSTKKAVDQIKKRMDNKKKIDTDDEAQALLNMLRNTKGDLNKADLEYIKQALIDAGYGDLLAETAKCEETHPEPKPETKPEQEEPSKPSEKGIAPEPEPKPEPEPAKGKEKPSKPSKKHITPKPQPKPEPKKPDLEPQVPPKTDTATPPTPAPKKPTITERGKTAGIGLAQNLAHELDSTIVDNKEMGRILSQVDDENAYSFFKAFQSTTNSQVNEKVFSVSDMFNKIGYAATGRAMKQLLAQAKSFGLENTWQYKDLANNINFIDQRVAGDPDVDPEGREALNSDNAINNLLELMGRAML